MGEVVDLGNKRAERQGACKVCGYNPTFNTDSDTERWLAGCDDARARGLLNVAEDKANHPCELRRRWAPYPVEE